jgi:hypothetical protein
VVGSPPSGELAVKEEKHVRSTNSDRARAETLFRKQVKIDVWQKQEVEDCTGRTSYGKRASPPLWWNPQALRF